jgi:ribosomal protein S6
MKLYELTYLISAESSEEDLKTLQEKINSLIQNEGGILDEVALPKKIELAYPIKKQMSAYLTAFSFRLSSEKLENLEKKIKAEDKILRYSVLIKPRVKEIPMRREKLPKKVGIFPKKITKPKAELKEIEKKLEEILEE